MDIAEKIRNRVLAVGIVSAYNEWENRRKRPEEEVSTEALLAEGVELLHRAVGEVLRERDTLDRIHAAMVVPFQWSADTPEAVWAVMESAGYRMPNEEIADAVEEVHGWPDRDIWADYRPTRRNGS